MAYQIPFSALTTEELEWRLVLEAYLQREDLARIDLLILSRCCNRNALTVARLARRRGIPVIYEIDDDLLQPPLDEEWGRRYHQSFRPQLIKRIMDEAALIKAGSKELAERLRNKGYQAVYLPYAVELQPFAPETEEAPLRIGYFGTRHHRSDIETIFPALIEVREALGEHVAFEFVGCYPERWRQLKTVAIRPTISEYGEFIKALANFGWSLGLAPLRSHSFNEAKSDSKFRDLSAAGIVGIYANLPPYRGTVLSGVNGWLCGAEPEAWYRCIMEALGTSRRPMVENARKQLMEQNAPFEVARQWLMLFRKLLSF